MVRTPIGRLRVVSILEGVSYLALLGVAMPLKYLADRPEAVRVVGSLHGLLALLFIIAVIHVTFVRRWSFARLVTALVASVIPFGAFALEASLRREQEVSVSSSSTTHRGAAEA